MIITSVLWRVKIGFGKGPRRGSRRKLGGEEDGGLFEAWEEEVAYVVRFITLAVAFGKFSHLYIHTF